MCRRSARSSPVLLLILGGGLLLAARAGCDGTQTGVIVGEVVDAAGAGLAGVEVTVSGPQIHRSALTDAAGRFRFPALGLGAYQVSAELLGLKAAEPSVLVSLGRTTEVRLKLGGGEGSREGTAGRGPAAGAAAPQEPSSQDWIQVIAETSVIDRFETRIGANVSFDFLDHLPVERFYQSVAMLLPGVAGGEDGNPNVSGALRSANQFLIDGVDTTDPTTGLFGLNLAYEAIQEVSVSTAAAPAEFGHSSGAVINVVTRSGSNEYRGEARLLAANNRWNSRYDYPPSQVAQLAPELDAANATPNRIDPTAAVLLGGPLWRDHVFFFGAYDDAQSTFLGPTHQGTLWDRGAEVETAAFKGTWQATPGSTLVAQHTSDHATATDFNPFDRGFAENRLGGRPSPLRNSTVDRVPGDIFALQRDSQNGSFDKLQWNSAFTQDLSLELTLAQQKRELTRGGRNSRGLTAGAPHVAVTDFIPLPVGDEQQPEIREVTLYNGLTDQGFEHRPRQQGNLSLSWFFQAGPTEHQLKAGVDYQKTESQRRFNFPGQAGIDPATGMAVDGQLFTDFDQRLGCTTQRCPPFDPATGSFQPFQFFNFWARGATRTTEKTLAGYLSDAVVAGRWLVSLGARIESERGSDNQLGRLVDDLSVAPRLAVTYDPFGDGKALLTASYGRYFEPFLQRFLDSFSNLDTISGYTPYGWAGPDTPACATANPADLSSPCWVAGAPVGFFVDQLAPPNRALQRSSVDELTAGLSRQLTPSTGVSLYYVQRRWNHLWDNVLKGTFDASGNLIGTTAEVLNLPEARRNYRAIELLVQKRFADHWQLLGSYTRGKTQGNLFADDGAGASTFANYRDASNVNLINRYGLAPYDRRDQIKLFANYQLPFRRVSLTFGTAVLYQSGVPFQQETLDPLGVRFVTPQGSQRLPDVFQLDLSVTTDFRLSNELQLEAKAEVFNLTNQRQLLGIETLLDTGNFGNPRSLTDLQTPRSYRFTLGLRF
ncbi:MAG TPA: TonB-dependent receptor [Thermoanaerobaculia bacterium]|nr:TonB-dependent receptor [Thermoanaerobaculia bacterium]